MLERAREGNRTVAISPTTKDGGEWLTNLDGFYISVFASLPRLLHSVRVLSYQGNISFSFARGSRRFAL